MRVIRIVAAVLLIVAVLITALNVIPPKQNLSHNPFMREGELPMICAHRGGSLNNPENTMLAFRRAVEDYGAGALEVDLYLTGDGRLICTHNAYIDETCNVNGDISIEEVRELCKVGENRHYVSEMTLDEIRQYNFGYYFVDENGERPYKDTTNPEELGLTISTLEELIEEMCENYPELVIALEVKADGEYGIETARAAADVIREYPEYSDRLMLCCFHREIEDLLATEYPDLMHGASMSGATKFIITTLLGVNILDGSSFGALQIPIAYGDVIPVPLDLSIIISKAHQRGIAVQYWTINDEAEMRHLIRLGCDAITTDNPALLREILDELEGK